MQIRALRPLRRRDGRHVLHRNKEHQQSTVPRVLISHLTPEPLELSNDISVRNANFASHMTGVSHMHPAENNQK